MAKTCTCAASHAYYPTIAATAMNHRVLVVSHLRTRGVPAQSLLIKRHLVAEGYRVHQVGRGDSGVARLLDVVLCGLPQALSHDTVLVDVFGGRAFSYELVAIVYGRMFGRRVVAMLRGGWLPEFVEAWPRLTRWALGKPDLVLTPHAFLADRLRDLGLRVDGSISNFVELDKLTFRLRDPLEPRFLYLRGTHAMYNPEMTLRAFALIQERYPRASLTFAGGDSKSCRDLASALKLRQVDFVGLVPKDEIPRLADRHAICVQSNRVENLPVSVLEMWACGLPVVGTRVGGAPYVITDEETGLLVPSEDHAALAQACLRLLSDPALARRLALNGRAKVETLTWETVGPRWREALALAPRPSTAAVQP